MLIVFLDLNFENIIFCKNWSRDWFGFDI